MTARHFGSIRRLPSGRYQARYRGPDGVFRPAPTTFARKAEAARWLSLVEIEMLRGIWVDPERGEVPLGPHAAEWIAQRPDLRPKTVVLYKGLLAKHIVPMLGTVTLGGLARAPELVREWWAGLRANGVSPTTAAKAYRLLRAILNTAVDDGLIVRNPCRIKGAGTEPTPERPIATAHQVFRLYALVPKRFRALVLLATFASLRWGEAIALRRRHVDLDRCTVRVVATYTEMSNGQILHGPPKSAAGVRTVAFPRVIRPAIARHMENYVAADPDALVFTGEKGGVLRRSTFNPASGWKRAVAGIGLPELHFHDLRHTGNTLAAPYASTRELMARMGHSSTRAAIIYQHATQQRDQVIADALGGVVTSARRKTNDAPRKIETK